MRTIDTNAEFCWKKKLWFEIGKTEVVNTLTSCSSNCILPFFKSCAKEGFDSQILEVLDQGNESVVFFFSFLFFFFPSSFSLIPNNNNNSTIIQIKLKRLIARRKLTNQT